MSYGFTRLVCINPPTKKEIQEWHPDLDEEAISILLQLLHSEYIQDQEIQDQDNPGNTIALHGIDGLIQAVSNVVICPSIVELGFYGRDRVYAVIQWWNIQKPAIAFYRYKEAYCVELTTESELMEKMKGI